MSHQVPSQNDFFIYVPSLQKDESHAHASLIDEKNDLRVEVAKIPDRLRAWVKVPLAGKICVYISLSQDHEEVACSN